MLKVVLEKWNRMETVQEMVWNLKIMCCGYQIKYVCTIFGSVKVVLEKCFRFNVLNRLEEIFCIKMT